MYFTTDITSDFSIVGIVRDAKSIFSQLLLPGTRRKYLKKNHLCLFFLSASYEFLSTVEREVFGENSQSLLTISAAIVISRETERRKKGKIPRVSSDESSFAYEIKQPEYCEKLVKKNREKVKRGK